MHDKILVVVNMLISIISAFLFVGFMHRIAGSDGGWAACFLVVFITASIAFFHSVDREGK